jgi:hypothetical protein
MLSTELLQSGKLLLRRFCRLAFLARHSVADNNE